MKALQRSRRGSADTRQGTVRSDPRSGLLDFGRRTFQDGVGVRAKNRFRLLAIVTEPGRRRFTDQVAVLLVRIATSALLIGEIDDPGSLPLLVESIGDEPNEIVVPKDELLVTCVVRRRDGRHFLRAVFRNVDSAARRSS